MSTASKPTPQVPKKTFEQLKRSPEFWWFVSHVVVIVSTVWTTLFGRFNARLGHLSYRLALLAAVASFGQLLFQKYGARIPKKPLADENFQFLVISLIWLFTARRVLAVIPIAIRSLFLALVYAKSTLLPAIGYGNSSELVQRIGSYIQARNESLTLTAANLEVALLAQLSVLALLFRKSAWLQLTAYFAFFLLRFQGSIYLRQAVKTWEVRADSLMSQPSVPPAAKNAWVQAKSFISRLSSSAAPAATAETKAR